MDELLKQVGDVITSVEVLDGVLVDRSIKDKLELIMRIISSVKDALIKFEKSILVANNILEQHKVRYNQLNTLCTWMDHLKEKMPASVLQRLKNRNCSHGSSSLGVPVQNFGLSPQNNRSPSPISPLGMSMVRCIINSTNKFNKTSDMNQKINTPAPVNNLTVSIGYIPNQEFDNVPQYMKGRLRVTDLNGFINIYNSVLNKKYSLLKKAKQTLKSKKDLDQWCNWKSQEKTAELKGQYFCTENDFSSQEGLKVGKRELSLFTILRHLKRIREIRTKDAVYYIACL